MKQVTYQGLTFEPYIEHERIEKRINEIAQEISRECEGENPLLLCVLNGAFPFAADLFRALTIDAEIGFIRYKSYEGTASTGNIRQVLGLTDSIEGRTVIVVEDIVDTGRTITALLSDLRQRGPKKLKVASLLFKPEAIKEGERPDYVGFEIPQKFIIGFGLDIDEQARGLNDIWVKTDD